MEVAQVKIEICLNKTFYLKKIVELWAISKLKISKLVKLSETFQWIVFLCEREWEEKISHKNTVS